jgi:hypothetical protein
MLELSKLTPAPWEPDGDGETTAVVHRGDTQKTCVCLLQSQYACNETNAEFIALARNAFDVMMRRGWGLQKWRNPTGWSVNSYDISDKYPVRKAYIQSGAFNSHADPFTALVKADEWLTQQEKIHA